MKLTSFRITKYRNIEDTGEITLEDSLTCIVGKNQSGKTALLRALHRFNPREPDPYDLRRDWPRGERRLKNPKQIVCTATFMLEDHDRAALHAFAETQFTATTVTVTKDYAGEFEIYFREQPHWIGDRLHPNQADALCEHLPAPHPEAGYPFRTVATECTEEARRLVREGRFTDLGALWSAQATRLNEHYTAGNPQPQYQYETTFFEGHRDALVRIVQEAQQLPTLKRQAHDYIVSHMPAFIYMDDYREFNGTALLPDIQHRRTQRTTTPTDDTFLMILKLAGLDLESLINQGATNDEKTKRERQYDLDDAARTLTKDVAGRWGQNQYRIEFRVDGQTFFTEIEEEGKHIGMIPLEEQSKGFRWFFSFDLRFMHDSDGTFKNCVLLLDEPGLHLHPGGQEDLLKRLDAYASGNTLVYTTHLPFLVDLREPHRIKVIQETDQHAIVTTDLNKAGPDEKLTLQAALGMKLSQHYLIAQRNLVVEGADDYWIITELNSLLARSGVQGLPDDVMITATGGASEAVYLTTFMIGQGLHTVTLFDGDDEGRRQEERLRTKWLIKYKGNNATTILLNTAIGLIEDAAIEDLFDEAYYLQHTTGSHQEKLRQAGAAAGINALGTGLLCDRIDRGCAQAGITFNKGSVAKLIRKDLGTAKTLDEFTMISKDKVLALFTALRTAVDRSGQAMAARP